jgi:hypothetical protein
MRLINPSLSLAHRFLTPEYSPQIQNGIVGIDLTERSTDEQRTLCFAGMAAGNLTLFVKFVFSRTTSPTAVAIAVNAAYPEPVL